jgi:hypothetical protein
MDKDPNPDRYPFLDADADTYRYLSGGMIPIRPDPDAQNC